MPRKTATTLEKATTPRGEDFLANLKLKTALESLANLVKSQLPADTDFPFGAIRDGAAMLAATEFDEWQEINRQRTENEIRRLQGQIEAEKAGE